MEVRAEGNLAVRGRWLFDGYVTADGTTPGPDADGWLTTSDAGRLEDGEVFVLGRTDEVVIAGGRNIFAEDVETAAIHAVGSDLVAVSAFRAEADPSRFAVAIEAADISGKDVTAFARSLKGMLAATLGVRVGPVIVLRPWTIPRTTSGKVKRPECRRLLAEDGWPERKLLAIVP
jgi:acyl-CoA synthetase (AMP-forming)/AMP-acid ligase II